MMIYKLCIFLLAIGLSLSAEWNQPGLNSHRANFLNEESNTHNWNFKAHPISGVGEVILTDTSVVAVALGHGFCYAPSWYFIDRNAGFSTDFLTYDCGLTHTNTVYDGMNVYSVVNNDFPSYSFVIDNNGLVPELNQTQYVVEIVALGSQKLLLNMMVDRWSKQDVRTLKLVDMLTKKEVWSASKITIGGVTIDSQGNIYSLSADRTYIVVLDPTTGTVTDSIYLYGPENPGRMFVAEKGPKNIYLESSSGSSSYQYLSAYTLGQNGTLWVSKPFGYFEATVLDNTGEFFFLLDSSFNELSILNTTTGRSIKVISGVTYYDIAGINDNNEIAAVSTTKIDFINTDGEITNTISPVDFATQPKCVLDKTAIYCCSGFFINLVWLHTYNL